jgi:hypothetical protein
MLTLAISLLVAGLILLYVMCIPVVDPAADEARSKGLMDTSSDGAMNPFARDIPITYRMFHPITTAYYRQRHMLPLLLMARMSTLAGLAICLLSLVMQAV